MARPLSPYSLRTAEPWCSKPLRSSSVLSSTFAPLRLYALLWAIVAVWSLAAIGDARADNGTFVGTGSCSSSNCHGSVSPRTGGNILFNEYVTWQRHDHHSQAYKVLENEESAIIARHLGLKSATSAPLCLSCHSTAAPSQLRGEKYQTEDGVSCEACHGAASNWLTTHTANGVSHKDNIGNGMVDLGRVDTRVKLCLSCHHGNEDKTVDHRLIGAGHPRLAFELDTFENIMPRHWELDTDYTRRKFDYRASSAWLTGQAVQAQEALNKALSPKRSKMGVFPEFTMYYCYACHHSLEGDQWKSRDYQGHPGEPRLNLASLIVLREALRVTNPKLGGMLAEEIDELNDSYAKGTGEPTLKRVRTFIAERIQPNTYEDFSEGDLRKILRSLATYGAETPYLPYEVAEQIAMGIVSIASDLQIVDGALKKPIDTLYASLKKEETFAPEEFTLSAQVLLKQLGR